MLCLVKNSGLLGSVAGQVRPLVALGIPQWLALSSGLLESDKYVLGLWETCAIQDTGGSVGQASSSLRSLATDVPVARVLLWAACVAASLGRVAVLLGPTCLRYGAHQGGSSERSTNVAGQLCSSSPDSPREGPCPASPAPPCRACGAPPSRPTCPGGTMAVR